jgi:hypothetical protein
LDLTSLREIALTIVASIGGIGVVILGLSSFLGKVWANRIMQADLNRHNREIEALKNKLLGETEHYRTRLRNSELMFKREFAAASDLVRLVGDIEMGHWDPWMDDRALFIEHVAERRETISKDLQAFLSKHAAILPLEVRHAVENARLQCVLGARPDVPDGVDANEAADKCYQELKTAEAKLLAKVQAQACTEAAAPQTSPA